MKASERLGGAFCVAQRGTVNKKKGRALQSRFEMALHSHLQCICARVSVQRVHLFADRCGEIIDLMNTQGEPVSQAQRLVRVLFIWTTRNWITRFNPQAFARPVESVRADPCRSTLCQAYLLSR